MRLPNGYGSIHKLSGNRRNPYRVRVTVGYTYDETQHKTIQRYHTIGYYPTYEEANKALMDWHYSPVDMDPSLTFAEVYRRWSAEKYEGASTSLINSYTAAYRAVPMLYDIQFRKIKRNHLQNAIDTCGKNYPTLQNIKLVIAMMYKYAIQNDLTDRDYSEYIDIAKHKPKPQDAPEPIHTDIKPEEIAVLWNHSQRDGVPETLMMIYSGMRVGEFFQLKYDDVNLATRMISITRSKTASGIRRVPIAAKTIPLWESYIKKLPKTEPLPSVVKNSGSNFRARLAALCSDLGIPKHLPHDTRHTCATLLYNEKVDSYIVKRILGHIESDITDKVYTHLSDALLLDAIDKI